MMLHDAAILRAISTGRLQVEPFRVDLIQPASIDLRLGREFLILRPGLRALDPASWVGQWDRHRVGTGESFILTPGAFVLASTHEQVALGPDLVGRLEGKSSLGRLGLRVHSTAGFIDPGFRGRITLELSSDVDRPIVLWPGMRIGQLSLTACIGEAENPYGSSPAGSHYQDQELPTVSRSPERFESFDHHHAHSAPLEPTP